MGHTITQQYTSRQSRRAHWEYNSFSIFCTRKVDSNGKRGRDCQSLGYEVSFTVITRTISVPGHVLTGRTSQVQRNYHHEAPVNDAVIHPNQGELISCDQAGSVKIWDLGENVCTHELVPDEDVAIRTITIASDGGTLVAGNDHVSWSPSGNAISGNLLLLHLAYHVGHVLCLEDPLGFSIRGDNTPASHEFQRPSRQIHHSLCSLT